MIFPNYEYFLRIAEYENISKAAESLYISQPSLSKYLKKLEESVGTELFERKQSSLRLTDGGRAFLE